MSPARRLLAVLAATAAAAALAVPAAVAAPALASPAAPATAAASREPATGVVIIETDLGYQGSQAAGTGFVVTATGRVLTNNHVIRGATAVRVLVPAGAGAGGAAARTYPAKVLGYSVADDVAVLQLQGATGLATATLGSSRALAPGDPITAVGNAGGRGVIVTSPGSITALARTITATDDNGAAHRMTGLIQTDAELEPGDSGGPLLDAASRVVGMDNAASSGAGWRWASAAAEGYAIPIDRVMGIARQIVAGRASATVHVGPTAWLGVSLQPISSFPGDDASGVVVSGIVDGGPAAQAGLVRGAVIVSLAGRSVTSIEDVIGVMQVRKPGQTLRVIWSDETGAQTASLVKLGSGPPQ